VRTIAFTPAFNRSYKSRIRRQQVLVKKSPQLWNCWPLNPSDPSLQTHKLKGVLAGSWACTVEYDCRIVFDFVTSPESGEDEILLLDVGSHDEVY
jgi:mRNA-degrading endonuclease YafQ of YafQ-DinJ toxin-antitoxin module